MRWRLSRSNAKRILIIEDEDHIAEGLKLNLELKGYTVRIALDGIAALQDWKEWRPDLIVLDIMLPGMLHGKILRSPLPHAKILNVDVSKAAPTTPKLPRMAAVLNQRLNICLRRLMCTSMGDLKMTSLNN